MNKSVSYRVGSEDDETDSPSLTKLLINHSAYKSNADDSLETEDNEYYIPKMEFEESSYDVSEYKTDRWKLGSQMGAGTRGKDKEFRKLQYIHQSISSKENDLDSKTIKRNMYFSSLLVQWFPQPLLDQAVAELHRTDRRKVVADQAVIIRILGYIEALLRVSCRSIPWSTIFEINNELGMDIDKKEISAAKFTAVSQGAFADFYKKRGNRETFDVIRFYMVRLIAEMNLGPEMKTQKKAILEVSRKLCQYLEMKRLVPKDPEIYGHAIVELACKQVLKTRTLQTMNDPRLKKKLSTAIHYIKKQVQSK